MVFNGFMLIASFQFYVIIYYVCGGDQTLGAKYAGYAGTIGAVCTFAVVAFVTWLATQDRQAARLLRLHRPFDYRLCAEMVLLQPRHPVAGDPSGAADGLRPGRPVHAGAVDGRRRGGHRRAGYPRAARRHVRINLLVDGEARHGRRPGRRGLPAELHRVRCGPGRPAGRTIDHHAANLRRGHSHRHLGHRHLGGCEIPDHGGEGPRRAHGTGAPARKTRVGRYGERCSPSPAGRPAHDREF